MTLAEIFRELQTMVLISIYSRLLIREQCQIEQITTLSKQMSIQKELTNNSKRYKMILSQASEYQDNSKAQYCIVVLLIIVIIMFNFLVFCALNTTQGNNGRKKKVLFKIYICKLILLACSIAAMFLFNLDYFQLTVRG